MPRLIDGSVQQSGHGRNSADYSHERINYPVMGVVLSVAASDDQVNNTTSKKRQDSKGTRWEADVLVLADGSDGTWIVRNAVILPNGVSGIDDFHEELPRPCSQMTDGSVYKTSMASMDPSKLDGDRCIVSFIGGRITQPIITNWFPHPANFRDSATLGLVDGMLPQGRRFLKRYAGAEVVITPAGSVHLDTNNSGSSVIGSAAGPSRTKSANGGDLFVSIKPGRQCSVNFNASVPDPVNTPSLPQPNPPQGSFLREEDKTTLMMNEDFINAVAGRVVQLIGKQVDDSILLGATPTDHAVLGEKHQITFNALVAAHNALVTHYMAHVHLGNMGALTSPQTGTPIVNPSFNILLPPVYPANSPLLPTPAGSPGNASEMPASDLSIVVKIQ